MLNRHEIIGRCGNDPEVRFDNSGGQITTVSVATSESWKDKQGNKQESTEWHRIVVFGNLAKICGDFLAKGSLVYFAGKGTTRKWQDQSGNDKYSYEIVAREMKMLGSNGDNNSGGKQQSEPWPDNTYVPNDGTGEDVPF